MKFTGDDVKVVAGMYPIQTSGGSEDAGVIIDRLGYHSCVVTMVQGAVSGTPSGVSAALKVEHGDASNLSDKADYATLTAVTGTTGNKAYSLDVDLNGAKRYIRVCQTVTFTAGTTPKVFTGATVTLGEASAVPAV